MVLIPTASTNALTLAGTTPTAAGLALLDDADASAQRTTLGLGTIATLSATNPSLAGATLTGHLLFTDNTYDIGASGATRPRAIYVAGTINAEGAINAGIATGSGEVRSYQAAGSHYLALRTASPKSGLYRSSVSDFILYYDVTNGNTVIDTVFSTAKTVFVDTAGGVTRLGDLSGATGYRYFNSYTNSTTYEAYREFWSGNVCYTGVSTGSSGTARLEVQTGAAVKALTGGTETAFVRISCADDSSLGGVIHYAIYAKDAGNDMQLRTGSLNFAIVNKTGGGGLTCGLGTVINEAVTTSSGTLTVTFDSDVSGANVADIRANAVSSLTETSLDIRYRVEIFGPSTTVTPL